MWLEAPAGNVSFQKGNENQVLKLLQFVREHYYEFLYCCDYIFLNIKVGFQYSVWNRWKNLTS
jgi:hypothetical protein